LLVEVSELSHLISSLDLEGSKFSSLFCNLLLSFSNLKEDLIDLSLDIINFFRKLCGHALEVSAGFLIVMDEIITVSILMDLTQKVVSSLEKFSLLFALIAKSIT